MTSAPATTALRALRLEHEALSSMVGDLDPSDLGRGSYATEWTVAQVLSHLGSASEINVSNLRAALGTGTRIPADSYPKLWGRWDASTPTEQRAGFMRWHGELVALFEELQETSPDARVETVMGSLPADKLAGIRLREAALHRWDIAVAFDPTARLLDSSVPLLIHQLPEMATRLVDAAAAKTAELAVVALEAGDLDRTLVLSLGEPVTLEIGSDRSAQASLRLWGEALVRLLYGRLHERDRASVQEQPPGVLDELTALFRGL